MWIEIVPEAPGDHEVFVRWGIWGKRLTVQLDTDSHVLATHKQNSADEYPTPLVVTVNPAARVRFGVGKFPGAHVLDYVWEPVATSEVLRLAGSLLADVLRSCSRTRNRSRSSWQSHCRWSRPS